LYKLFLIVSFKDLPCLLRSILFY